MNFESSLNLAMVVVLELDDSVDGLNKLLWVNLPPRFANRGLAAVLNLSKLIVFSKSSSNDHIVIFV